MKLLLIVCLVSFEMYPQQLVDSFQTSQQHTSYLGSESVNPFTINQIQIPINTKTEASLSLILKSNSGNTMIHKTTLSNKNGGFREIEYDAVIEKEAIYFTYPFDKKIEAFFEISFSSASGNGQFNPMNWIVQDAFIEKVHEFFGKSDLFKRKELGFENFTYSSVDEYGNISNVEPNKVFSVPFLTGVNYYLTFFKNESKIISGNASLSFKIPLKSISTEQSVETGFSINISKTKKGKHNSSITTTFHSSVYYHELAKNNDYMIGYNNWSYKLAGLLGFNFYNKKNSNVYSFFTTLNKTSSRLNSNNYSAQKNNLNQQALKAATKGNEYFEFGTNYAIHFKNKNTLKIELTIREDLDLNLNSINKILIGRNSEDFGVFIGFQYLIP